MKIVEVLENIETEVEQTIKVEGFLMDTYDYAYIAPNGEKDDIISESIWISDPKFIENLVSSDAPPAGGGRNSYPYNIVAEGKIFKPDNSPFPLALKDITLAYLEREGNTFQVI